MENRGIYSNAKKEKPLICKGFGNSRFCILSHFLDSGSSGGNSVEVQVLSTAPAFFPSFSRVFLFSM